MSPHVCARTYRAPEICLNEEYDKSADIFSLGCILYEMMKVCIAQKYEGDKRIKTIDSRSLFRGSKACYTLSPLNSNLNGNSIEFPDNDHVVI